MERRKDSKGRVLEKGESQRKDGTYVFQYTLFGFRKSVYAKTLNELRKKEKQIKRDIEDNIKPYDKNITLNDLFEKRMRNAQIRKTTRSSYIYTWDSNIRYSALAKKKIGDIKKSDIISFCTELSMNDFENSTIRNIIHLIGSCFKIAVEDDVIRKNPCDGCAKHFKVEGKEKHALTRQEQAEFLNFVKNSKYYSRYYTLFIVMTQLALRCGEALGLTWNDIDFDKRVININHQIIYSPINGKYIFLIGKVKTESGARIIPMTNDVYRALKEIKAQQVFNHSRSNICIDNYSDFIFTTKTGNVMCRQFIDAALRRIVDAYNKRINKPIELPHISAHILRHTGCTRMGEAGIDPRVMQYLMGHSDMRVTMKIYNHISEERNIKEISKLENAI